MKYRVHPLLALLLVLLAAGAGFWAGSRWNATHAPVEEPSQTFFATITEVYDNSLLVQGLEINDINHRWRYSVSVGENTKITWRYEPMAFSELQPGQTISITYVGGGQETDPVGLTDVTWIQLLDDEK